MKIYFKKTIKTVMVSSIVRRIEEVEAISLWILANVDLKLNE